MAHNLFTNSKGETSFFSVQQAAWHRLGKVVPEKLNAEQAIKTAGLDYEVIKRPIYTTVEQDFYGEKMLVQKDIEKKMSTIRVDTGEPLGVVGDGYAIVQNREVFSFFDEFVDREEAIYETAGVLGKGEKIWVMAKLPAHIKVGNNDRIQPYVVLMTGHDGRTAINGFITMIRVVCNNTLTAAKSTASQKFSISHTASAHTKLKEAHKLLNITNMLTGELEECFNIMSQKPITGKQANDLLHFLLPNPEKENARNMNKSKRERIMSALTIGAGADMPEAKGTAWGLFNGITYELDHMRNHADDSARLNSIWMGSSAKFRQQAFDTILEFCN